jgi:hypothetical protein
MEITGRIIQKLDLQTGTSTKGPWQKQDFIIETNDKFPKKVCITGWAEKVDELKRYNINDAVKLSVNVESREFNGRWYTDIKFWKIEPAGEAGATGQEYSKESVSQAPAIEEFNDFGSETSDDLPF